jgi:hypothetical protein
LLPAGYMVYLVEILLAYVQKMHYSLLTGISGSNFCTCKKKAEVISLTYRLDDHRLSLSLSLSLVFQEASLFVLCHPSSRLGILVKMKLCFEALDF